MNWKRILRTLWRMIIGKNSAEGITTVFTKVEKQLNSLESDFVDHAQEIERKVGILMDTKEVVLHEADKAKRYATNVKNMLEGK